jgi:hypothetical protein
MMIMTSSSIECVCPDVATSIGYGYGLHQPARPTYCHPAQPSTMSTASSAASPRNVHMSPSRKHPMSVSPVENVAVASPMTMPENPYASLPALTNKDKGQKRSAGHPAQPSTMSTAPLCPSCPQYFLCLATKYF